MRTTAHGVASMCSRCVLVGWFVAHDQVGKFLIPRKERRMDRGLVVHPLFAQVHGKCATLARDGSKKPALFRRLHLLVGWLRTVRLASWRVRAVDGRVRGVDAGVEVFACLSPGAAHTTGLPLGATSSLSHARAYTFSTSRFPTLPVAPARLWGLLTHTEVYPVVCGEKPRWGQVARKHTTAAKGHR